MAYTRPRSRREAALSRRRPGRPWRPVRRPAARPRQQRYVVFDERDRGIGTFGSYHEALATLPAQGVVDAPRADPLAWRLRLTTAERSALKSTTIGAVDANKAAREAERKARRREAERERRRRIAMREGRTLNAGTGRPKKMR